MFNAAKGLWTNLEYRVGKVAVLDLCTNKSNVTSEYKLNLSGDAEREIAN